MCVYVCMCGSMCVCMSVCVCAQLNLESKYFKIGRRRKKHFFSVLSPISYLSSESQVEVESSDRSIWAIGSKAQSEDNRERSEKSEPLSAEDREIEEAMKESLQEYNRSQAAATKQVKDRKERCERIVHWPISGC